ncbi:MAG: hypothetical protein J2P22_00520 [Nocardioides sp.]|nr:hypothetical protein [Nocardioides sp.]
MPTSTTADADTSADTTIHLGRLAPTLLHGLWLVAETVVVPAILLFPFVRARHDMIGLLAVLAWRSSCIFARWLRGARVPATVWMAFALFAARTVSSLAVTSVVVYLWQPIILSVLTGGMFVVAAFGTRPLTMRLAHDFVHLPASVTANPRVRHLFRDLTLIYGVVHLASAAVGAWAMRLPPDATVAVHGGLGVACTVVSVGVCVGWGLSKVSRIPGLRVRLGEAPVSSVPRAAVSLAV